MKLIVLLLARACRFLHWLPWYHCQLAEWSFHLDRRFRCGIWLEEKD